MMLHRGVIENRRSNPLHCRLVIHGRRRLCVHCDTAVARGANPPTNLAAGTSAGTRLKPHPLPHNSR